MPECAVCGGGEFDLSDGLFFCSECGTQSQDVREEVAGEDNTLFNRTLTAKKEKRMDSPAGKAADLAGPSSLEKLQLVLQKQCDALIGLGFHPTLREAVKLIWFQYLKHYGYAFNEVEDDDSKAEITSTSRGRKRGVGNTPRAKRAKMELNLFDAFPEDDHLFHSDSDSDSDLEWEDGIKQSGLSLQSGEELYLQRRSDKLCKRIAPVYFTLKHTIALCYLALLYTKQNVMLSDLSRWIRTNKVPYHNLPSVLPRAMMLGRGSLSLAAVFPMTADNIQICVRHLYHHLPLPPLPPPSAEFVCHTLLDRLKLPACLHRLVDRVLTMFHTPNFLQSLVTGKCKYWRFDGECLAVIILLLKLLYKLDDKFEIEQPSATAGHSLDKDEVATGDSVYVWTDWVQLYCQHLQDSVKDGIPQTESEFVRVKDWQKYLDFCRVDIFANTRPTPLNSKRRYFYNPELYTNISGIFRQYCSKSQHRDQKENSSDSSSEFKDERQAGQAFTPRVVPLESLLVGPMAPCRDYEMLPCSKKQVHLTDIQLSRSMQFLLKVGSELIDITVEELYSSLVMVETSFRKRTLLPLQRFLKLQHP